jgi:hypothetical protein
LKCSDGAVDMVARWNCGAAVFLSPLKHMQSGISNAWITRPDRYRNDPANWYKLESIPE